MAVIKIQTPLDQPSGKYRLLDQLIKHLQNPEHTRFRIITAFAKQGPFLKLYPYLNEWKLKGKTLSCIVGIDENGTSNEALEFIKDTFSDSYIARLGKGAFHPTFHPKIYIFQSDTTAIAFIGSNNMTVGGLEINAESFVELNMIIPQDQDLLDEVLRCWNETLAVCLPLTQELLTDLINSESILSEVILRERRAANKRNPSAENIAVPMPIFPDFKIVPPSSYPKPKTAKPTSSQALTEEPVTVSAIEKVTETFVIQIIPHHNGEIFLSKTAIDQNPVFFGWPFLGATMPKKEGNPSYPQRNPDPIINLVIFDKFGNAVLTYELLNLNTVYYKSKSEIRITVNPEVYRKTDPYSVMVMKLTNETGVDYNIYIYNPGSPEFDDYLNACNQTMPSGGKSVPRKFGWL